MKFIYYLFAISFFVIAFPFVAAEDCFGMDANCPAGFYVNCYEDATSYNWDCQSSGGEFGPEIMSGGSFWCDSGFVIDYKTKMCCPNDSPYQQGNICNYEPQQSPDADNYYTRRSECRQEDSKCVGFNIARCLDEETEHYFYKWVIDPKFSVGVCGYIECSSQDVKCEGKNYFTCLNNKWVDVGPTKERCGVKCFLDSDCPDDIEVNSFCVNGKINTNYVDNFCNTATYSCEKKTKVIISDLEVGKCDIECFSDSDCKSKEEQNSFCNKGTLNINYNIETCENYQCVPDIITETSREIGVCDLECNNNLDCVAERTTGKYWKDKSLYYDIITQVCDNDICTDIVQPIFLNEKFETNDMDIDAKITLWGRILNWFKKWF